MAHLCTNDQNIVQLVYLAIITQENKKIHKNLQNKTKLNKIIMQRNYCALSQRCAGGLVVVVSNLLRFP